VRPSHLGNLGRKGKDTKPGDPEKKGSEDPRLAGNTLRDVLDGGEKGELALNFDGKNCGFQGQGGLVSRGQADPGGLLRLGSYQGVVIQGKIPARLGNAENRKKGASHQLFPANAEPATRLVVGVADGSLLVGKHHRQGQLKESGR